jgi:hypothetical protein
LEEWKQDYEIRKNMMLNGGEKAPSVYNYYTIFQGQIDFSLKNGTA